MSRIAATWRLATPPAAGGVAIIQLEGDVDGALAALRAGPVAPGRVVLRSIAGLDTGLVARWTPNCAHLMPHAGTGLIREMLAALAGAGIPQARDDGSESFPEAADELEARMLRTLARASSPLAIDLLLDQPRRWREHLERGGPGPDAAHSQRLAHLIDPPLVVLLGPANIGKSTLTNALAGAGVSIVSDVPGTTRDHVGVTLDLGGLVVRLADTPGLRPNPGPEEAEAAGIALELASRADLLLLCGDAEARPPAAPPTRGATLRVRMRADRGPADWPGEAEVSGLTGEGVASLVTLIRDRLVPPGDRADPRPWRFWPA